MKEKPQDQDLHNQELQSTGFNLVGKDQHLALDDASHVNGCVDTSLDHGLSFFEAAVKKMPLNSLLDVSRLSQGFFKTSGPIQFQNAKSKSVKDSERKQREVVPVLEHGPVAGNDSFTIGSGEEQTQVEEEVTVRSYTTEDEVQQVVDYVMDHIVNFFGLSNEFKTTPWPTCNPRASDYVEPVPSRPLAPTSEDRELLSSSRSPTGGQSDRENAEDFTISEETGSEIAVHDADLTVTSESRNEYELETFSRHSLMEDKSKTTEPDQVKITHRGKEMLIDRRTLEAVMDFLAYPEKYLQLNQPKTYNRKLIASLKRRREEIAKEATLHQESTETRSAIQDDSTHLSDLPSNLNEPSRSTSDRSNFEKVMDFIAFPEKHCIPKLTASFGRTATCPPGPSESPCRIATKYDERILADFLDQHCNVDKNALRNNAIVGATQQEQTSSVELRELGDTLNELRRDRSLLSQCSSTTDDSSHSSVKSNRSGRFFGRSSSRPQRNKNAVERYLAMAKKK